MKKPDKKALMQAQPTACRVLSHALLSKRISHAWLFHGPQGAPLGEMAMLFALSLTCEHPDEHGFACLECSQCKTLLSDGSADFYRISPQSPSLSKPMTRKQIEAWWTERSAGAANPDEEQTEESRPSKNSKSKTSEYRIRKEDIQQLQNAFSVSSLQGGKQIYILEDYDRATPEASNSLLKFFEEPKDNLVGILTSSRPSAILPTILSRAQQVLLKPASAEMRISQISALIDDPEYSQMLARSGYDLQSTQDLLETVPIFEVRDAAAEFWQHKNSPMALYRLQASIFKAKSDTLNKASVRLFLYWLLFFAGKEQMNASENNALGLVDIRMAVLEALDVLSMPLDLALLVDRVCTQILRIAAKMR